MAPGPGRRARVRVSCLLLLWRRPQRSSAPRRRACPITVPTVRGCATVAEKPTSFILVRSAHPLCGRGDQPGTVPVIWGCHHRADPWQPPGPAWQRSPPNPTFILLPRPLLNLSSSPPPAYFSVANMIILSSGLPNPKAGRFPTGHGTRCSSRSVYDPSWPTRHHPGPVSGAIPAGVPRPAG